MSGKIVHNGIVEMVDSELVKVRILQTSACSACKVAGHCSAAESKEKIVDVKLDKGSIDYKVGDAVVVSTSQSAVSRALMFGFVLPFLVMVAALTIALAVTSDELVSAIAAIVSLVPYYLIIYLAGERLTRSVTFGIEKRIY
ncbi:MAG: SoxR reducing system RseC family protein [Prevotella sp.]